VFVIPPSNTTTAIIAFASSTTIMGKGKPWPISPATVHQEIQALISFVVLYFGGIWRD
jgi:hypothetical protein